MSYYGHYRNQPGWGTPGYQTAAPPGPVFMPQPGWRGRHFYRAQAAGIPGELDQELFEHAWRDGKPRIGRKIVLSEARKWHRRVYGGVDFPGRLLPHELGAAAGYEAFQQWAMYGGVYRSALRGEKEREKEALAGIATGEVAKLAATITPGQRRSFLTEASAIAIGVALKLRKEAKEDSEDFEEVEEEPIGRRGGRPRLRKRRSSFAYGDAFSSDSDGERLDAANLSVPGRYPPMAGGAGLALRSPMMGTSGYASGPSPRTTTILPQATGVAPQAGYGQPGVTSNAPVSIPAGHRRIQYVTSSGQPIQYVTSSGQPIIHVTPSAAQQPQYAQAGQQPQYAQAGQQYAQAGQQLQYAQAGQQLQYAQAGQQPQYVQAGQQPQYAQAGQQPQYLNAGYPYGAATGVGSTGLAAQPQYAVAGQQAMMPGQQQVMMPGQQAMMPGQQALTQQYTGAYGAGGQVYGRPRAYSMASPAGVQRVF
ncbi:hypothetical protein FRC04_003631 [Tulasnella sp. 424]|nr:hypothetical protein FRC04_003631 [Tulasnella sp. 424]KAG8965498.1 hypothetical protein FRC05_003231 [Tulasnella sp. 425]